MFSLFLAGCYSAPSIEGFDADRWKESLANCDGYRLQGVALLLDQVDIMKGSGQNSIHELLGKPTRHELYNRNQKFFYYDLTCPDVEPGEQLLIRFDALGNLREISKEFKP
ncbi:MAG: hypothetical protein AAGA85_02285 [Bacteroidota bacterium]